MSARLRALTPADEPLLWELLYHAIYVPPGSTPPGRDIIQRPELARYVAGWGHDGDSGLAALDAGAQPVGAAWLRVFSRAEPGYGYVDDATPELSIALLPAWRGHGLGTHLLHGLLDASRGRWPAISLSVAAENPAVRLYQRLGFDVIRRDGDGLVMRRDLRQAEPG